MVFFISHVKTKLKTFPSLMQFLKKASLFFYVGRKNNNMQRVQGVPGPNFSVRCLLCFWFGLFRQNHGKSALRLGGPRRGGQLATLNATFRKLSIMADFEWLFPLKCGDQFLATEFSTFVGTFYLLFSLFSWRTHDFQRVYVVIEDALVVMCSDNSSS